MIRKFKAFLNQNYDIQNQLQQNSIYDFNIVEKIEIINISQNEFLIIVELKV